MADATPDALSRYLANLSPTARAGTTTVVGPNNADLPSGSFYDGTYVTPGPGGSSTGSGSGSGPGSGGNPALDWHAYLINWGFDQDIVNELDRIFRSYTDPSQASMAAVAYIRGTEWYTRTFPGIQEGMRLGVVSNEQDYRSYVNQLNDVYRRYYGRDVTGDEVGGYLKQGYGASHVNAHLQGQGFINANKGDLQYVLGAFGEGQASDEDLNALGDQEAGLDNAMGQVIQRRVSLAQQRLHTIMQGSLATPSLSLGKFGQLMAPSLAGGRNSNDVAS